MMWHFYYVDGVVCGARKEYPSLTSCSVSTARTAERLVLLTERNICETKRRFCMTEVRQLLEDQESLRWICSAEESAIQEELPTWMMEKIQGRNVSIVNQSHPKWREALKSPAPKRWRINLVGLGDVGTMLLIGLRLLGRECIEEIGIYTSRDAAAKRLEMEINQVNEAFPEAPFPEVKVIPKDRLMDCDLFVFCGSKGVPPLGEMKDVRLLQLESNRELLQEYAKMAREHEYRGIFAVVSDPVDLLCKGVFLDSNTNAAGVFDGLGLGAEQIRGFGLGVMNARAAYYAAKDVRSEMYPTEGRAYGPHGKGLVIANSLERYDDTVSRQLSQRALGANMEVRDLGFKPYIAPALSSGSYSLIAMMEGRFHYSCVYLDGAFLGIKNKETQSGIEIEVAALPNLLYDRIQETHRMLKAML